MNPHSRSLFTRPSRAWFGPVALVGLALWVCLLGSAMQVKAQQPTWSATGSLGTARALHTSTLLANGKVLVTGGVITGGTTASAELYDPATGTWSSAGTMNAARSWHAATLLPNGRVLVAGGYSGTLNNPTLHSSAELYDPATGSWTPTGSLSTVRAFLLAVLLPNGKVLVACAGNFTFSLNTAELYDPATGQWSATGSMLEARDSSSTLTLLANGQVLVVGNVLGRKSAELYDPATGSWRATADLSSRVRLNHEATLLLNGKVLVTGGNGPLASAELYDSGTPAAASVSAASYRGPALAPDSIVAAFGEHLAPSVGTATGCCLLPQLAGVSVKVRDSATVERLAGLFFVSPGQINYLIPPGTATGPATVTITNGASTVAVGMVEISSVAPGLFTADASGQGLPAALVVRIKADGTQQLEPVASFDPAQNRFVAVPIDLGPATEQVFLVLFGTGIRFRSSLSSVTATMGAMEAEVQYAGPQGPFFGLDQVNVRLPRALAGRGEVDVMLSVDGKATNPVRVSIR
jgi:uncharacterized protein (TIGR03437 family)